jgi:hypothetical protein
MVHIIHKYLSQTHAQLTRWRKLHKRDVQAFRDIGEVFHQLLLGDNA